MERVSKNNSFRLPPRVPMLSTDILSSLSASAHDRSPVKGLTHCYYRYPARFSPRFAHAAIMAFTDPGDVVYDPFMGGGTTLVEASSLGRKAIGTDINSLAFFISNVKTTPLSNSDISTISRWVDDAQDWLNLKNPPQRPAEWIELGYQKNISCKLTWPIRKCIELALANINTLKSTRQKNFVRCLILKTAQWALDCRKYIPSAKQFRYQLLLYFIEMSSAAIDYRNKLSESHSGFSNSLTQESVCLHRSAVGIENEPAVKSDFPPRLILTSPPYPGVHVLYHRWQVNGRREAPAPYWITNSVDGCGGSYYTFGDRKQHDLSNYFDQARSAYESLAKISNRNTFLIQLVSFSEPGWQLQKFLKLLNDTGFAEIPFSEIANTTDGRLWRQVPNRKFYTDNARSLSTKTEVLLIHKVK